MAAKLKVDYDFENDILWLYSGNKVDDSLELDNFVVDFSKSSVVGLEINKASEVLSRLSSKEISKEMVENIKEAVLKTHVEKNLLFIVALIKISGIKGVETIPVQINAPRQVMVAIAH
jgi:uncharacterized protein YuzE